MNRKAFLLAEQTLKMIIAVIAIIFLIYLLTSLYFSNVQEDRIAQATSILKSTKGDSLEIVTRNLNPGESKEFLVFQPLSWSVFSFTGSGVKPDTCLQTNCICICDEVIGFNLVDWSDKEIRQAEECAEAGVCLAISNLKNLEEEISQEIELEEGEAPSAVFSIKNEGGEIVINLK